MSENTTTNAGPRSYLETFAALIHDRRVSHGAFRLWHALRDYTDHASKCFPGQRRLAADIGCNIHSVKRWTGELVAADWLEIAKGKPGEGFIYTVMSGNGQPLRKVATPTVAESGNGSVAKTSNGGVAESGHDPLRKVATKVRSPFKSAHLSQGGNPPPAFSDKKSISKKREMWQLLNDQKKTQEAIREQKGKSFPDTEMLTALRAALKNTNDEIRSMGKSNQPGEDAPAEKSKIDRNVGTYNANQDVEALKSKMFSGGSHPPTAGTAIEAKPEIAPTPILKKFKPSPELAKKFHDDFIAAVAATNQ